MDDLRPSRESIWRRLLRPAHFRFSMSGLMVFTLGIAVGLSVVIGPENRRRIPDLFYSEWGHGVLAAVATWFVLGLIAQGYQFWTEVRACPGLSPQQHWGFRFAIAWRVGVALLLVANYVIGQLLDYGVVIWGERENLLSRYPEGPTVRELLFNLLLFVVVSSIAQPTRSDRKTSWQVILSALGVLAGLILALIILMDWQGWLYVTHLVTIVTGLASGQGLYAQAVPELGIAQSRESQFLFWSFSGGLLALLNFMLVGQLSRQWMIGLNRRLFWGIILTVGLVTGAIYPIWVITVGLESVSPSMRMALEIGPIQRWVMAFIVLIVAITGGTYKLIMRQRVAATVVMDGGNTRPRYYHEQPAVLLLLVVVPVFNIVQFFVYFFSSLQPITMAEAAGLVLEDPRMYVPMAVMLVATDRALRALLSDGKRDIAPHPVAFGQFMGVWLGLFFASIIAIGSWTWMTFALWLSPWWR